MDSFDIANANDYTDISAVCSAIVCYRLGCEPLEFTELPDGTMEQSWYGVEVPTVTCVKTVSPDDPAKVRITCRATIAIPDLLDTSAPDIYVPIQPRLTTVITFTTNRGTKNAVYEKILETKDLMYHPVGNPEIVGLTCTIGNEDSFDVGEITEQDSRFYFSILDNLPSGYYYSKLRINTDSISMNKDDYYKINAYPIYTIYWKDIAATEHVDEYDSYEYRYQDVWGENKNISRLIWDITEKPVKNDFIIFPYWNIKDPKHPFIEGHTYDVYVRMELSVCGSNTINFHTEEHVSNTIVETSHKTLTFCPEGTVHDDWSVLDIECSITNEDEFGIKEINPTDPETCALQYGAISATCIDRPLPVYYAGDNIGCIGCDVGVNPTVDVVVFYRKPGEETWSELHTTTTATSREGYAGDVIMSIEDVIVPGLDVWVNDLGEDGLDVPEVREVKVQFTYTYEYGIDCGYTTHTKQVVRTTDVKQLKRVLIRGHVIISADGNFKKQDGEVGGS